MYGHGPDDWFYAVECPTCKVAIPTSIFDKKEKQEDKEWKKI